MGANVPITALFCSWCCRCRWQPLPLLGGRDSTDLQVIRQLHAFAVLAWSGVALSLASGGVGLAPEPGFALERDSGHQAQGCSALTVPGVQIRTALATGKPALASAEGTDIRTFKAWS